MTTVINGKDINQPFYINLDCDGTTVDGKECGNHLEILAQPGWKIGIRGLSALRWTCMECGKVYGGEEFELAKQPVQEYESKED